MDRRAFLSLLASAAAANILPTRALGVGQCSIDDVCGPGSRPGTGGPGAPPTDLPPLPDGITSSLYGAFNMNDARSNQQIYTVGWSSAPNGYHPVLASDGSEDGAIRWGGFHKLITTSPMDPLGNAEVHFVKSPTGLGEQFIFKENFLRIKLELMDWAQNTWYRRLMDSQGNPGYLWAQLDLPSGEDIVERGLLDYYRCQEPRGTGGEGQLFEQHEMYSMNRLYGPYDISTPEGMAAARRDITFHVNPHLPEGIPDVWKTFGAQLGHPDAHTIIYALRDLWGPRDTRLLRDLSFWGNIEGYMYAELVKPGSTWRRGAGLVYWGAGDEPDHDFSGNFKFYRQQIMTTIRPDVRTRMLELCEVPTKGAPIPVTVGLGSLNSWYHHDEMFMIPDGFSGGPRFPDAPYGRRRPKGEQRILK